MIGYWHHPVIVCLSVCPSVRPSVCNTVHSDSRGRSYGVPSRHVPILPFGHFSFSVGRVVKTHRKKRVEENANVSFLRQTIRRALVVLRSVFHWLRELWSVTLEWIEFGCVHKLYPLNRIVRTSSSSTCNWNRFNSLPVYRTSWTARSAITATAELLVQQLCLRVQCHLSWVNDVTDLSRWSICTQQLQLRRDFSLRSAFWVQQQQQVLTWIINDLVPVVM